MQLERDVFYKLNNRYVLTIVRPPPPRPPHSASRLTLQLLALPYLCIIAFVPPMVVATGRTPELLTVRCVALPSPPPQHSGET